MYNAHRPPPLQQPPPGNARLDQLLGDIRQEFEATSARGNEYEGHRTR